MSEQNYPSDKAERIMVRLPDGMRDRLAVVAKENGRSVNAEVVLRLEESLAAHSSMTPVDVEAIAKKAALEAVVEAIAYMEKTRDHLSKADAILADLDRKAAPSAKRDTKARKGA